MPDRDLPAAPAAALGPARDPAPGPRASAPAPVHRALRRLRLSPRQLGTALLVAAAANGATWLVLPHLGQGWASFFSFWVRRLELEGGVSPPAPGARWIEAALPAIDVTASAPDAARWWAILAVTAAALVGTRWLPDRLLPFRYLVRFACAVQGTALAFFAGPAGALPYTLPEYARSAAQSALWLMLVVPWVHALTYGIFGFSLSRKAALTALTLVFLAVVAPFLLVAHVCVAAKLSLLVLPVLFFLCGTPLLILSCIGLYGWAMSWERADAPDQAG